MGARARSTRSAKARGARRAGATHAGSVRTDRARARPAPSTVNAAGEGCFARKRARARLPSRPPEHATTRAPAASVSPASAGPERHPAPASRKRPRWARRATRKRPRAPAASQSSVSIVGPTVVARRTRSSLRLLRAVDSSTPTAAPGRPTRARSTFRWRAVLGVPFAILRARARAPASRPPPTAPRAIVSTARRVSRRRGASP